MRYLLILLLSISTKAFAQNPPDFGKVRADTNFCTNYSPGWLDSIYNIPNICNTVNQLELRFWTVGLPMPNFELITLSYDSISGWQAFKYTDNYSYAMYDTAVKQTVTKLKLKPAPDFETLFDALKRNDIFTLPNQRELKFTDFVLDGTNYEVTFKAGDKFRTYTFYNPEILLKRNRQVKEFKKYIRIARLFYNSLTIE